MVKQPTKDLTAESYTKPRSEQRATIGELDKELVNYLFAKIKLTWGEALFESQFGEPEQLRIIKRDWAHDLLQALRCQRSTRETDDEYGFRAKSKIDAIFSEIRHQVDDGKASWRYPNLKQVCAYMSNRVSTAAHRTFKPDRALEDQGARERAREVGARELERMKKELGL